MSDYTLIPSTEHFKKWKKDDRRCAVYNYVPHMTPVKESSQLWYEKYDKYIVELYRILINKITKKYPKNKIDWSENNFRKFINLIYHSSSKYIDDNL